MTIEEASDDSAGRAPAAGRNKSDCCLIPRGKVELSTLKEFSQGI